MAAIAENFGDLLDPRFRKIFSENYNSIAPKREMLYTMETSTMETERDSSVGAFGSMPPFTGTIQYDDVTQGYDTIYTHCEFANGFKIQRRLWDDQQFRIMDKKPAGLALCAAGTKEEYAASPFNTAFSGSGTITIAGTIVLSNSEGLSLCNSSHTSTANSDVQSNTGTSALSKTSVEAARKAMRAFKNDRGKFISIMPDTIVVPPNLEDTAWEIVASKGKPGESSNTANFNEGRYKVMVWDYLTDSNNWFLADSKQSKNGMLSWTTRIGLEFAMDADFDTMMKKWAAYERYSFGYSDWRFIYGSQVG